jgi:hypothetical protein
MEADEVAERAAWPQEFERWWLELASRHTSLWSQEVELADFPENVPRHWGDGECCWKRRYVSMAGSCASLVAVLDAFYSAKHGRPVGVNRKQFIEVAHYVAESYAPYLLWFRRALKVYDRAPLLKAQDKSGNWAKRVKAYVRNMRIDPEKYAADQKHQRLFEFLFPELMPLPLSADEPG